MTYLDRLTQVSNKKIEVCSELISDAKNGKDNNEIIVFIGDYKIISQTFSCSLRAQNININYSLNPIENFDELTLNKLDTNIILVANTQSQINTLLNVNRNFLVIDARNINHQNLEETIIYRILKNSDKYKKFNIRNKKTYSAYIDSEHSQGAHYENFS